MNEDTEKLVQNNMDLKQTTDSHPLPGGKNKKNVFFAMFIVFVIIFSVVVYVRKNKDVTTVDVNRKSAESSSKGNITEPILDQVTKENSETQELKPSSYLFKPTTSVSEYAVLDSINKYGSDFVFTFKEWNKDYTDFNFVSYYNNERLSGLDGYYIVYAAGSKDLWSVRFNEKIQLWQLYHNNELIVTSDYAYETKENVKKYVSNNGNYALTFEKNSNKKLWVYFSKKEDAWIVFVNGTKLKTSFKNKPEVKMIGNSFYINGEVSKDTYSLYKDTENLSSSVGEKIKIYNIKNNIMYVVKNNSSESLVYGDQTLTTSLHNAVIREEDGVFVYSTLKDGVLDYYNNEGVHLGSYKERKNMEDCLGGCHYEVMIASKSIGSSPEEFALFQKYPNAFKVKKISSKTYYTLVKGTSQDLYLDGELIDSDVLYFGNARGHLYVVSFTTDGSGRYTGVAYYIDNNLIESQTFGTDISLRESFKVEEIKDNIVFMVKNHLNTNYKLFFNETQIAEARWFDLETFRGQNLMRNNLSKDTFRYISLETPVSSTSSLVGQDFSRFSRKKIGFGEGAKVHFPDALTDVKILQGNDLLKNSLLEDEYLPLEYTLKDEQSIIEIWYIPK